MVTFLGQRSEVIILVDSANKILGADLEVLRMPEGRLHRLADSAGVFLRGHPPLGHRQLFCGLPVSFLLGGRAWLEGVCELSNWAFGMIAATATFVTVC